MYTFEEVFSFDHLKQSALECLKGVRWKQSSQMFEINLLQWLSTLHKELLEGTYKSKGFTNFTISERGKLRNISSVHISERCVQKCLVTYALRPLIVPRLIHDNCATVKGRGTDFAIKRLREHLRYHLARYGRAGGILTMDYHNYFASIPHVSIIAKVAPLISDNRLLNLLAYFIECFPGSYGLGLGSEISQLCAVYYCNNVDHYFKDKVGVHGYGRYMDDSYLICADLDKLKQYRDLFIEVSRSEGLEVNETVTQITPFDGGHFTYLKKRIFITDDNKIIMRLARKNITRRRRSIVKQNGLIAQGKMTPAEQHQSFVSWRGYANNYASYNSANNLESMLYCNLC